MISSDVEKSRHQRPLDAIDWQVYRNLSLQPHGFGKERVRIWPRLLNVDDRAYVSRDKCDAPDSSLWSDASFDLTSPQEQQELPGNPHSDERQITLDTDRSFVLYSVEGVDSREKLQAALNRLIVSVFRQRPRLHYFQGYHDIVSVVFLTLPKELHLPVTEKLSLHRVRDSMGPNLDPVVGLLRVLKRLLELVDPHFAESLERTAPLPYYALSNLLTLFSHDVPTLPLIQHIFDYLLCRPPIAVVYLAAALTLTRREEVQMLEEEGEEGMMHSLLTVFPDLYEEGDDPPEPHKAEVMPTSQDMEETSTKEEDPDAVDSVSENATPALALPSYQDTSIPEEDDYDEVTHSASPRIQAELSAGDTSDEVSTDAGSETLVDSQAPTPMADGSTIPVTTQASSLEPDVRVKVQRSEPPLRSISDDDTEPSTLISAEHEKSPLSPAEADQLLVPISDDEEKPPLPPTPARTSSPEPLGRPRRPRISLTTLLTRADELMREYPPTHPQIALSTIMGPQSVVHTWSERARDLPSDDDAERMVLRPDLIVCPPPPEPVPSDDEREREHERKRRERRRKLRKPRRLTDVIVQRKTMVAGAVLVLGVAMAVYGFNGGALPGMGGGHGGHRGAFGREWRRVGKLLGGFMVGAGERMFEGIRQAV
ncbi:rab-GTPase-TBC domain-containing protein [Dichomitus squalens]|uniref:Rab-GTPase-TBC domain-containing protein n=1 Tax=Dichomitus squalens TaxID=114155 RepID=A0A4Q9MDQ0_9APHY|nr:rab-GTPase-TBC domain-containing protein [Dichomitus squalens]